MRNHTEVRPCSLDTVHHELKIQGNKLNSLLFFLRSACAHWMHPTIDNDSPFLVVVGFAKPLLVTPLLIYILLMNHTDPLPFLFQFC